MRCPYCSVTIHPSPVNRLGLGGGGNRMWYSGDDHKQHEIEQVQCPSCSRTFITHEDHYTTAGPEPGTAIDHSENQYVLLPRVSSRPPAPKEVPPDLASLYDEAALILADSPRGSAALSRRCLQQLMRDHAGAPHGTPYSEIEWMLANQNLPSYASVVSMSCARSLTTRTTRSAHR